MASFPPLCCACAQADFVFGYSLPLATVVSRAKGGLRQVELPFSSPIQNLLVADLTVKARTASLIALSGLPQSQ